MLQPAVLHICGVSAFLASSYKVQECDKLKHFFFLHHLLHLLIIIVVVIVVYVKI